MRHIAVPCVLPLVGYILVGCSYPAKEPGNPTESTVQHIAAEEDLAMLAGSYYFGDGLGVNCELVIDAGGRFSFAWHGCLGKYAENDGSARLVEGYVVLSPEKPNDHKTFHIPTEFLPVKWGPRTYLVAKKEVLDFCNAVNQGTEPRSGCHGLFYLQEKDWDKAVQGLPRLPGPWSEYLLAKTLRGLISRVVDKNTWEVDLGSRDGVREGMELTIRGGELGFVQVKVTSVEENHCLVRPRYRCEDEVALKKGQQVSSRFFDDP